ncbi:multidrug ABC transporter ATP-binding protein [Nocardiopsis terrae]|uniref:ABC-2 type transport system ATP-binding protein n=1 Tax=Nocardiopsis terrae TaxID=372655 RepID=A0ABR9HAD8_9ACTN|nr:ABC transporter ATP-binding protein [Nocardiopsis terrae]MBE1455994.1 ABC-2 type transport system ATP-binding protein [Nocardiopsis terrae]GHC96346.1 multidrug ABC transporter ATP-binding protein [Nocardiopsis terrae]
MTTTANTEPAAANQDPAQTGGPSVVVRDLHQHYGDFEAVKGVSFEIRPGELFALLGTNGAGKTTTIETLEGFRRPSSGSARVFGRDPFDQPAGVRERANAVLQGSGLLDDLSVDENLGLASDLAAAPRDADEVLGLVDLTDKRKLRVRQLSGGQKRRLDLALALISDPEVLYLDEPTTGMDPEARNETWKLISELKESGVAILLTTHYLEEAERLADRLAIMHRGRVHVEGTLAGVLAGWGDRVSFLVPSDVRTADLPEVDGAEVGVQARDQALWATYTVTGGEVADRAHHAVSALFEWAREQGTTLQHLQVRGASLEDVFLRVADDTAGTLPE